MNPGRCRGAYQKCRFPGRSSHPLRQPKTCTVLWQWILGQEQYIDRRLGMEGQGMWIPADTKRRVKTKDTNPFIMIWNRKMKNKNTLQKIMKRTKVEKQDGEERGDWDRWVSFSHEYWQKRDDEWNEIECVMQFLSNEMKDYKKI